MNKASIDIYKAFRKCQAEMQVSLENIKAAFFQYSLDDQVDLAYSLRECEILVKEMKARVSEMYEIAQKVAAIHHLQSNPTSPVIETKFCRAEPDCQKIYTMPRAMSDKHPEERVEYEKLMAWLCIDPQLWDYGETLYHEGLIPTKVVDIHWPGFQAYCHRLTCAGHPPPDGIDPARHFDKWQLKMRKKREITETL